MVEGEVFTYLCHQFLQEEVMGLAHYPVRVATQSPARDWTNKSFAIWEEVDEVRNELW